MAISLDKIISITNAVIDVSTTGLDLVTTVLTKNSLIPNNTTQFVLPFTSAELVGEYFVLSREEYIFENSYFISYDNSPSKPRFIRFARYIDTAVAPYIRGGIVGIDKLSALKAVTAGSLALVFDGATVNVTTIDLSSATSLSNVASLLQAEIRGGTLTNATVVYDSTTEAFTISNAVTSGTSTVGYVVDSTGIGLGSLLKLRQTDGAVLSQGSIALTPAENMEKILAVTKNWYSFTNLWNVSTEVGYVEFLALANWCNSKFPKYNYIAWSNEANMEVLNNNATMKYALDQYNYSGVSIVYNNYSHAAFFGGMMAGVDYTGTNTVILLSDKQQGGLAVSANSDTSYEALIQKKVNFYGNFNSANSEFRLSCNGYITGAYKFMDNQANNSWLADQIQIAEATLLANVGKLDYGSIGQNLLKASVIDVMNKSLTNGVVQTGKTFDETQKAILKQQAGIDISGLLTNNGYYIKITPPAPSDRANRPAMKLQLWYANNGGFFTINNTNTYIA
jgi:hypothetical protein